MSSSYLQRCLLLFAETVQARFGWRPDYAGLERSLEPVRRKEREFTYRDLETIQNGRYWDFRQFWRFPAESDIERELDFGDMSRLMGALPLDEREAIARLHAAFKYIENVSVVLRFVNPEHYGIISPPVEKVLEVRRGRTEVETYMNYLRDIRDVRDHHGLVRAADADMALWVLQERVLSSYRDHDLLHEFRCDTWLLRRRAVNLLAELGEMTGTEDHLDLARALVEAQVSLAGILAGFELERALRARLGKAGGGVGLEAALERVMASPAGQEAVAKLPEGWRDAARVRDRFLAAGGTEPPGGTGPAGSRPSRKDAMQLIEEVERLREGPRR